MTKIISLFQRNYDGDRLVRDEVVPGAEWVIEGEGVATRKWDGTCCMVEDGFLLKRYTAKKGKSVPCSFLAATDIDEVTGKIEGWLRVGKGPEDKWHREAFHGDEVPGTYELCGPKVQGNPEEFLHHLLIPHGNHLVDAPREYETLKEWLKIAGIEGVVWHHPDGRMVKIKAKDFGIKRTK